jgi:hypothetical protein
MEMHIDHIHWGFIDLTLANLSCFDISDVLAVCTDQGWSERRKKLKMHYDALEFDLKSFPIVSCTILSLKELFQDSFSSNRCFSVVEKSLERLSYTFKLN